MNYSSFICYARNIPSPARVICDKAAGIYPVVALHSLSCDKRVWGISVLRDCNTVFVQTTYTKNSNGPA